MFHSSLSLLLTNKLIITTKRVKTETRPAQFIIESNDPFFSGKKITFNINVSSMNVNTPKKKSRRLTSFGMLIKIENKRRATVLSAIH